MDTREARRGGDPTEALRAGDAREALRAGYTRSARDYDAIAGGVYLGALRQLLPEVRIAPCPAVLDVASGTGLNLFEAAAVFGPCERLAGVDLSPGMVDVARANARARRLDATFVEGDAEALPTETHRFDLVVCNSAYHWFTDGRRAIAEQARVLRSGGQAVVTTLAAPAFEEWTSLVRAVWRRVVGDAEPVFPRLPSPTALLDDFTAAGLAVELYRYERRRAHVADVEQFLASMRVVVPTWLPDASDAAARVLAETRSALAGGLHCTFASVQAIARKGAPPLEAVGPRLAARGASGFGGLGVEGARAPSAFVGVGASTWGSR